MKKVYIAGKITGKPNFERDFNLAEHYLRDIGKTPVNPICLPRGLEYEEYMHICFAMLDVSDEIVVISDWRESKGAVRELEYALIRAKKATMLTAEDLHRIEKAIDSAKEGGNLG